jgi:hypothetical protein
MDNLVQLLSERTVGQTVKLGVIRNGDEQNVEVALEEWPARETNVSPCELLCCGGGSPSYRPRPRRVVFDKNVWVHVHWSAQTANAGSQHRRALCGLTVTLHRGGTFDIPQ